MKFKAPRYTSFDPSIYDIEGNDGRILTEVVETIYAVSKLKKALAHLRMKRYGKNITWDEAYNLLNGKDERR